MLPPPHLLIWVLEPQRRWHIVNQSLVSFRHSEMKRLEVQAKLAISGGNKKERMQSWMSSGKSEKENEESVGSLGLAIIGSFFSSGTTLFCRENLRLCSQESEMRVW